jgi:hypothetical protein
MKLTANISIDKLIFSVPERHEVFYDSHLVPNYRFEQYLRVGENYKLSKEDEDLPRKYKSIAFFYHKATGNRLRICSNRKRKHGYISPLYIIFDSSYEHPLSCDEVFPVRDYFKEKHNVQFRPSEVHIATDLIGLKNSGLHDLATRSIKAGKKGAPTQIRNGNLYFGGRKTTRKTERPPVLPVIVVVYDKARELWEVKKIRVPNDITRIEVRLKITRLGNFATTLEELADHDWSFIYPKYFSLLAPTYMLKRKLRHKPKQLLLPTWLLKKSMRKDYGAWPSNFYRDLLKEHPQLSNLVRQALADYRWCPDYLKTTRR